MIYNFEFDDENTIKSTGCDSGVLPEIADFIEIYDGEKVEICLLKGKNGYAVSIKGESFCENFNCIFDCREVSIKVATVAEKNFLLLTQVVSHETLLTIFEIADFHVREKFFVKSFEVRDNSLICERKFFDSLGHSDRLTYLSENGSFVRKIENFGTYKSRKKFDELIPVYFFESIKAEHFDEAKSYCKDELKNYENSNFTEYFKDYDVLFLKTGQFFMTDGQNVVPINFEMQGNLIVNFSC